MPVESNNASLVYQVTGVNSTQLVVSNISEFTNDVYVCTSSAGNASLGIFICPSGTYVMGDANCCVMAAEVVGVFGSIYCNAKAMPFTEYVVITAERMCTAVSHIQQFLVSHLLHLCISVAIANV